MLQVTHERLSSGRVRFEASCPLDTIPVLHRKVSSLAGSFSAGTGKKARRTFRRSNTTGDVYTCWMIYEYV